MKNRAHTLGWTGAKKKFDPVISFDPTRRMVKSSCPSKEKALLLCRQLLARLWVDRVGSGGRWGEPREEMVGGLKERALLPRSGYTSPALQIIDSLSEEVPMWVVV